MKLIHSFFVLSCLCGIFSLSAAKNDYLFDSVESCRTKGTTGDDANLIRRIVLSYQKSAAQQKQLGSSMWKLFFNERHAKTHRLILENDIQAVTYILRNPGKTELFYGFDPLTKSILEKHQRQNHSNSDHGRARERFKDLVSVLQAMDPEFKKESRRETTPYAVEDIIARIEKHLGTTLSFPNHYPDEFGLKTSRGVASYRAIQAIYQAWKIKQIVADIENPRVLEIGPGLGRTAHFSRLLGIKDYTIVDIPFSLLSSSYFLGRTLGEDNLHFSFETVTDEDDLTQKIKILTPRDFMSGQREYDLIVNFDSMTEMDPATAAQYISKIAKNSKRFLSVNHSLNPFTVRQLLEPYQQKAKITHKRYPIRKGYNELLAIF